MARALAMISLVAALSGVVSSQALGVLRIKVTLTDPSGAPMPVPSHALLISDNPNTTAPRRVVTATDGTAMTRLRPGNYTVESDEPLAFNGKGYQWTRTIDITAGGDVVLELNAANAEVGDAPSSSGTAESAPSLLLPQWRDSVVGVWTPASRASGFLVDASGLVATSQRAVGSATAVDVQLTPSVKVAARVLVADRRRDAAILWIDREAAASVRPLPLGCATAVGPPLTDRQKLVAIGAPIGGPKEMSPGDVIRLEPGATIVDFRLAPTSLGGPAFNTSGGLVGLTSVADGQEDRHNRDARLVPRADACDVMQVAENAIPSATRPAATHLPVEPLRPFPADALAAAVEQRRAGSLNPYQMSTPDFEVAFLTPVIVAGQDSNRRQPSPATDFGVWSEYFADHPPVLAVRVTPKMAERFWTTMARGAALTQGMALPAFKHFKPGFSQLRVYCGEAEVTPIHPFIIEQRVSETDAVREGLYVFDPDAIGPHCKPLTLLVSSEKDPRKQESRVVDPQILDQIWRDFAPYRTPPAI